MVVVNKISIQRTTKKDFSHQHKAKKGKSR